MDARLAALPANFWTKAVAIDGPLPTPCLVWTGALNSDGRPLVRVGGKVRLAYRVSLAAALGVDPALIDRACHRCNCPQCVAPDHLYDGSQAANVAQMIAEGRANEGGRNGAGRNERLRAIEIRAWAIQRGRQRQEEGRQAAHVRNCANGG